MTGTPRDDATSRAAARADSARPETAPSDADRPPAAEAATTAGELNPAPTTTEWVYDLRGMDLVAWAERAGAELRALTGPRDRVLLLVGESEAAALAALRDALARAGYPARAETVLGIAALALGGTPAPTAEEEP